jgi:hypothetical protein
VVDDGASQERPRSMPRAPDWAAPEVDNFVWCNCNGSTAQCTTGQSAASVGGSQKPSLGGRWFQRPRLLATAVPARRNHRLARAESWRDVRTQLSRSRRVLRTAGVGHEDQFAPSGLSGRRRFSQQTFAEPGTTVKMAPIAVIPGESDLTGGRPETDASQPR